MIKDLTLNKIRCITSNSGWHTGRDETSSLLFGFSDGVIAQSTTSVLFDSPSRFEIYGSDGYAICDGRLDRYGRGEISLNGSPLQFEPVCPFEGEI